MRQTLAGALWQSRKWVVQIQFQIVRHDSKALSAAQVELEVARRF